MDYPPWLKQSLRSASKKSSAQTTSKASAGEKGDDPVTVNNENGIESNSRVCPKTLRHRRDTALSCLTDFEQTFVKMRFGFDGEPTRSDAEIAAAIGKSEREVRDLADVILRKLRWPTQH